jgi:hypothetical protein
MKENTPQDLVEEVHRLYGIESELTLATKCLERNPQATPEDYYDFIVKYMEEED